MQKVITIVGPTAVGKTSVSIEVAKHLEGEVISADSRQVYRGLDIGSGKVTKKEMGGIAHHLIDVADPKDTFTAHDFIKLGRTAIDEIVSRDSTPIIVGGTGFYVDALVGRVGLSDVPPNKTLREKLKNESLKELQSQLRKLDPDALSRMDTQNPRRLMRAIEIAKALGSVPKNTTVNRSGLYEVLWIGLTLPLPKLKERIHTRLLERFDAGMLDEAKRLYADGLSYERMEELGLEYRFLAQHLSEVLSYEEMFSQLEVEIGKYAKRQMTWFKKNKEIRWFNPDEKEKIITLVKQFQEK